MMLNAITLHCLYSIFGYIILLSNITYNYYYNHILFTYILYPIIGVYQSMNYMPY